MRCLSVYLFVCLFFCYNYNSRTPQRTWIKQISIERYLSAKGNKAKFKRAAQSVQAQRAKSSVEREFSVYNSKMPQRTSTKLISLERQLSAVDHEIILLKRSAKSTRATRKNRARSASFLGSFPTLRA